MRIVFITTKLNFVTSGASVEELDLKVRTFIEHGHECLVVTLFSSANKFTEALPYRVVEEQMGRHQFSIQKKVFQTLKKYESQADIFYIDGQVYLYGAGVYRLLGGKRPVCAHFNRELMSWPQNVSSLFGVPPKSFERRLKEAVRFFAEKWIGMPIASHIDAFSFTNPYLRETYRNFGLQTEGKSLIAGDAFDFEGFMRKYGVAEHSYWERNKRSGVLVIYYSSRMAPGKGFDALIEAFSKIKNKDAFRLVLGGTGPEDDLVKKMVHDLGLDPCVTFTGWAPKKDHYERLKKICDIFVQPMQSGMDKTSYILLEAMAFGIPSVLPEGGGLQWDAKDSAIYFKGGDTDDLARKIEKLGSDAALRERLSGKTYERLREPEMDFQKQVRLWEDKMRELLER